MSHLLRSPMMCAFLLATGCEDKLSQPVALHGVRYEFPASDIHAAVYPPSSRLFVRLAPPDAAFHLILDEWNDLPGYQGPGVPRISRLNDVRNQPFAVSEFPSGPVVCTDRQPHFNCGLQIIDGSVRWSVLFDRKDLQRAEELRRQATTIIEGYRAP
jgi:hypothetical protein